jgi:hypothetical protein
MRERDSGKNSKRKVFFGRYVIFNVGFLDLNVVV